MRRSVKTFLTLGSALLVFWTSVIVIFAKGGESGSQTLFYGTGKAVDHELALVAAGIVALIGIIIYLKRNKIFKD